MWGRWWRQTLGNDLPPVARGEWLRWLLSAFGLWLLVATGGLWWNRGEFPQVPWFAWGRAVPQFVDLGLLLTAGISLLAIGMSRVNSLLNHASLWGFAASLTGLMLLDQHRSQPWAYQLVLVAIVLASGPHSQACGLLRLLTVSIYVHSAVSKCDYSFCAGLGQHFLTTVWGLMTGRPVAALALQANPWPLIFPVGELLIALGLIWPGTRRWALWGACGMHLALLLILGPWGLQHSAGVLIWNGYFIGQNWLLFARSRPVLVNQPAAADVVSEPATRGWLAVVVVTGAVCWPCLEPWGGCDLWPAWGLYAQHGEQLRVTMTESGLRRLPVKWQNTAVAVGSADSNTWQIRPQQVALQTTGAPLYPQNRYVLGVIIDVFRKAEVRGDEVSVECLRPANRLTGLRSVEVLSNLEQIEAAAGRQVLNALPRRSW